MKEKEHLFSKNISDLSTEQFKELCENIDKSFVVIRRISLQDKLSTKNEEETVYFAHLLWINH